MRIESDPKLDFKDVLIRPKRSTLGSRSEVDIKRHFDFKWSGQSFDGCANYGGQYGWSWHIIYGTCLS